MKNINEKGFTLIELLAVITIMGILMLVAIPAVSRTIENSRRDTFADIGKEYINAVRNGVLADNVSCYDGEWRVASANTAETYFFPICTSKGNCTAITTNTVGTMTVEEIESSTKAIMESGGKSPFGGAEMQGYVKMVKDVNATTGKTTTTYYIQIADTGKHGLASEKTETELGRGAVITNLTSAATNVLSNAKACKVN